MFVVLGNCHATLQTVEENWTETGLELGKKLMGTGLNRDKNWTKSVPKPDKYWTNTG